MKIWSQQAVPNPIPTARPFATIATISGVAALLVAGLYGAAQPAAAQQGGDTREFLQLPRRASQTRRETAHAVRSDAENRDGQEGSRQDRAQAAGLYRRVAGRPARLHLRQHLACATRTRVSTGQAGHRTPTGVFSVIGKERWHHSNIYSGAPMPFMQRITWSGVATTGLAIRPRTVASAFPPVQLFGMQDGRPRHCHAARRHAGRVTDTLLPLPKMQAVVMPAGAQQAAAPADAGVELASMGTQTSTMTTAAVPEVAAAPAETAALLNPIAYAAARQALSPTRPSPTKPPRMPSPLPAVIPPAPKRVRPSRKARKAEAAVAAAQATIAAIDARIAAPVAQPVAATPAATGSTVEADKAAAQSELARAQSALEEARTRDAAKSPAAFNAVEAWKRAVAAGEAAADLVAEASRREQVSVFISKKEGRIFIRQDWKDVCRRQSPSATPTVPSARTLAAVEAAPDGWSMRWTAMSMPPEAQSAETRSRGAKDKPVQSEAPVATPETAAVQASTGSSYRKARETCRSPSRRGRVAR